MPMLFLVWMTAASFLSVSWLLSPWYAMWLVLRWSEPALHVKQCLLSSLWLSQPYQGQGLHLSCWSRNPSSVSELHCEVGGIAVLPLRKEPPSIPPPELSIRDGTLLYHWSPIVQGHMVHCFGTALSPASTMEKLAICSSALQALFFTRQPVWIHWISDW